MESKHDCSGNIENKTKNPQSWMWISSTIIMWGTGGVTTLFTGKQPAVLQLITCGNLCGPVLGPLLFSPCIKNWCGSVKQSKIYISMQMILSLAMSSQHANNSSQKVNVCLLLYYLDDSKFGQMGPFNRNERSQIQNSALDKRNLNSQFDFNRNWSWIAWFEFTIMWV